MSLGGTSKNYQTLTVSKEVGDRLIAQGRAIEREAEKGLSKATNDILAIVGVLLALVAFGFAIWAAWWAIEANNRATAQAKQFATHTDRFLETIEQQTLRISAIANRADQLFGLSAPPAPISK